MTIDRWASLIGQLQDAGKVESKVVEDIEGHPGTVERVIVNSPIGRMRLSWTTQPKRLTEKVLFSKRGSSAAAIQTDYDQIETIHVFTVEKLNPVTANWERINPEAFA